MNPSTGRAQKAPGSATATIVIETISYINDMVGHPGQSHTEFRVEAGPADTIRDILRRFADGHPKLKEALWDANTGEMGPHVEVIVNDAILDIHHTLDSHLRDGDHIILTGQYIGG